MACGMLAFIDLGIPVKEYYAYEIDKYAIQTTTHNFPFIHELGDVFEADFTKHKGVDYLIGGSPCTHWSIAQKYNRETEAKGIGWDLFCQYVRALKEAQPRYFLYENNKSMSKAIYQSISDTFGFEPIMINSAKLTAQNRQRYYWVGKRNDDGTYSKVEIDQPEDKGILLKNILEQNWHYPVGTTKEEKSFAVTAYYSTGQNAPHTIEKHIGSMVAEPVNTNANGKSHILKAQYHKNGMANFVSNGKFPASAVAEQIDPKAFSMVGNLNNRKTGVKDKAYCLAANPSSDMVARTIEPVTTRGNEKAGCLRATYSKIGKRNLEENITNGRGYEGVAEPVCMRYERSETAKKLRKDYESGKIKHGFHEHSELHPRPDGKTNTVSTVLKDNPICEPVDNSPVRVGALPRPNGELSTSQAFRIYDCDGKSVNITANGGGAGGKTGLYAVPIKPDKVGEIGNGGQGNRIYSINGKSVTQQSQSGGLGSNTGLYAVPVEFDNDKPIKAISCADSKTYQVYEVYEGQITIKGKLYPIKLQDGFYIIRKLTVRECMRLQTVPEWYEFPVSNTQAYKMLGNGWSVKVISHLLKYTYDFK